MRFSLFSKKEKRQKGLGRWELAWLRFKENKFALTGCFLVGIQCFFAIFAPIITPYSLDSEWYTQGLINVPPSLEHPFGIDKLGRDVFTWTIYGARTALYVGLLSTAITFAIALLVGLVSGYLGGLVDEILMRFTDALMIFPSYLFILLLIKILGELAYGFSITFIAILIGLFGWPGDARIVRGQVKMLKGMDFVEGCIALGVSQTRIIFKHILPGVIPILVVSNMTGIGWRIMEVASITFLGFGDPTICDWGAMMNLGRDVLISAWWQTVFPGFFLFLTVLGFNMIADGLADALNPRLVR